ncbi:hypothetical protein OJ253_387 [Cryptosporidium canis]|uniref:Uncharacterized protein n=1 Tax=Cryptosporidium canis TaxID=195482 RepID=A0A9D5DIW1_9CRYT|nr:hypothetical protein OJ253_387 [Cryptosporidium canis]
MTPSLINKNRTPTRARGERVYKPGGKKEWRVVFWTHESTKPSRRQCSFSEAKYGKEAASLLSRAVLDYIDVKGVVPDDLHDPPILDPAKKELIEYYSALHESRKAIQKKNKPKNGNSCNKSVSEPSIVPLYTLTQARSPTMTNISGTPPSHPAKTAKSEKSASLASIQANFGVTDSKSSSPNEPRVVSPPSTTASTGGGLNTELSSAKSEIDTGNPRADNENKGGSSKGLTNSVQIPPIPNITSSVGSGSLDQNKSIGGSMDQESENMNDHFSRQSKKSSSQVDGFNAMINNVISNFNKQSPLLGGGGAHFALMGSIFPNQMQPGIQSPLPTGFLPPGASSILPDLFPSSYNGFNGLDINHALSQACQQIALQNHFNFLSHIGYLNQLAGLTIAGIGGNMAPSHPNIMGASLIHNFPVFHGQETPINVANAAESEATTHKNVHIGGTTSPSDTNPSESIIPDNREITKTGPGSTDNHTLIALDPPRPAGDSCSLSSGQGINNDITGPAPASASASADHSPPLLA